MSSVGMTQSASAIKADYLKLLTAQLSNQNPLDPMDNKDMTSQLAQLSQLEQMETMNKNFSDVLADQRRGEAATLIGKQITFFPEGMTEPVMATVDSVDLSGGAPVLRAGPWSTSMDSVLEIRN